ncbi:MAG TPA: hypothetical protein VF691_09180 [Cytophagaceae bacterium]|jgi:hypothetical protein
MKRIVKSVLVFALFLGCSPTVKDTFNTVEIISSKGEKIYINSLNWGITDDYQISIISANKDRVKDRKDTIDVVKGLEPFIYSFKNDSLKLFFHNNITYRVKDDFKTINVSYSVLKTPLYDDIKRKSYDNDGYYSVPMTKKVAYPSDMPSPPSNKN